MKALVFSNFPEDFNRRCLLPNLTENQVEVLGEVMRLSKAKQITTPGEANTVIVFYEMASHDATRAVKAFAKSHGLKYVGLSRKVSQWPAILHPVEPQRPSLPTPVQEEVIEPQEESVSLPPVAELIPELTSSEQVESQDSYLLLLEEENARLTAEVRSLKRVNEITNAALTKVQEELSQTKLVGSATLPDALVATSDAISVLVNNGLLSSMEAYEKLVTAIKQHSKEPG